MGSDGLPGVATTGAGDFVPDGAGETAGAAAVAGAAAGPETADEQAPGVEAAGIARVLRIA